MQELRALTGCYWSAKFNGDSVCWSKRCTLSLDGGLVGPEDSHEEEEAQEEDQGRADQDDRADSLSSGEEEVWSTQKQM